MKVLIEAGGNVNQHNNKDATPLFIASINGQITNVSLNDSVIKMRAVSPKYVPREWMLVDAYKHAEKGDYSLLKELEVLFRTPYDEQSLENENKSKVFWILCQCRRLVLFCRHRRSCRHHRYWYTLVLIYLLLVIVFQCVLRF